MRFETNIFPGSEQEVAEGSTSMMKWQGRSRYGLWRASNKAARSSRAIRLGTIPSYPSGRRAIRASTLGGAPYSWCRCQSGNTVGSPSARRRTRSQSKSMVLPDRSELVLLRWSEKQIHQSRVVRWLQMHRYVLQKSAEPPVQPFRTPTAPRPVARVSSWNGRGCRECS
jgi:hypothetical protein